MLLPHIDLRLHHPPRDLAPVLAHCLGQFTAERGTFPLAVRENLVALVDRLMLGEVDEERVRVGGELLFTAPMLS